MSFPPPSPPSPNEPPPGKKGNLFEGLQPWEIAVCGLPLILILLGGCIGGAFGGAAFAANLAVWRTRLPMPAKLAVVAGSTLAAFAVYLVVAAGVLVATN